MSEKFDQFAIVELFGRQIIAGRVSEALIGGQGFVRVDVPATDVQGAFTKYYGPGAIYAITPCDEDSMLQAVEGLKQKPVELWKLNISRQLPAGPDWDEIDRMDDDED
jgi:hypothetical protein